MSARGFDLDTRLRVTLSSLSTGFVWVDSVHAAVLIGDRVHAFKAIRGSTPATPRRHHRTLAQVFAEEGRA